MMVDSMKVAVKILGFSILAAGAVGLIIYALACISDSIKDSTPKHIIMSIIILGLMFVVIALLDYFGRVR